MRTPFSALRWSTLAAFSFSMLAAACGDDGGATASGGGVTTNDAPPLLIAGGGVGSGAIKGKLNVYAIDAETRAPLEGADVRVGEPGDASPLVGKTDGAGLVTFKNDKLAGPATITVTASGHAAATWFGANGANVTVPVDPPKKTAPATANASGTIQGWDALPVPAMNHATIAFAGFSWTGKLGDAANDIKQPKGMGLDPNACAKLPAPAQSPPCDWKLVTRTGKQAHYAIILDVDTKGTGMDQTDDVYAIAGFAFQKGLDITAGQTSAGESLVMFPAASIVSVDLTVPMGPTGLSEVAAIPVLNIGDEGQIPFYLGALGVPLRAPMATDVFAGSTYDVLATATTGVMGAAFPTSISITRGVDVAKPITVPAFQATPADLAASGGTYSFRPIDGATIHSAAFYGTNGDKVWSIAILDERDSFELPVLSPDPLPSGMGQMVVNAITIPGADVMDFSLDAAQDAISALSENGIDYTH